MKKTIGIVAPFIGDVNFRSDYKLRLARSDRELTLKTLYELAQHGYRVEKTGSGHRYEDIGTAAGYYLSSVLRQEGYNTVLTTTHDDGALQRLAAAGPFAVCLSTSMIIDNASLKTIVRRIRRHLPDTLLIAGGAYVWKSYFAYEERP